MRRAMATAWPLTARHHGAPSRRRVSDFIFGEQLARTLVSWLRSSRMLKWAKPLSSPAPVKRLADPFFKLLHQGEVAW